MRLLKRTRINLVSKGFCLTYVFRESAQMCRVDVSTKTGQDHAEQVKISEQKRVEEARVVAAHQKEK